MLDPKTTLPSDPATIRRDLEYMTRHWHQLSERPMLEIRALGEGMQTQSGKFALDWMDDAVEFAVGMNRLGRNVYAVRNPIRERSSGSASDTDIIAARYLWADCDDPLAAGNVLRFDGPKWTAAVKTGTIPDTRAHVYWELSEWCYDLDQWRAMQTTIAAHFASDPAVINPSRIMRLAGTITYPAAKKRERGYVSELVTLNTDYSEPRLPVTLDQMARVFGSRQPAVRPLSQQAVARVAAPPGAFQIDTGGTGPSLNREQVAIQALSGMEWHNAVIRLVASYVAKGLTDPEIHALTQPLTLPGYTGDQTAQEVQTAIDGARRKGWTPTEYARPEAITPPPSDQQFDAPPRPSDLEWFDDIEASTESPYIIKGVLDMGAMSVVYGPSNSGKTFFALDLAYHVAIGAAWRGRRIRQAAVLYLAAEGGRGVKNRFVALKQSHGILDVPMALRRAGLDLLHGQADLQHIVNLVAEVKARLPDGPVLVVIDTLSRIMAGGDENNAADMTALIRNIDAIRETTQAHVMLVHHTGKDTARGARGHSSLRAATDTEVEVGNENGARAAQVTKQRDNAGGETFPFNLKNVTLGVDQDGDEITSCVVESQDEEEHAAKVKMTKGLGGVQKLIAETFDQMIAEGLGRSNPGGVGMPETGAFWAVEKAELRRISMGKITASDPKSSFNKAMIALTLDRGLFCTGENLVWRKDRKYNK